MGRRYETVSFLSDYGTTDEFVGVVHSVIRDLAPHARIIDLTHGVPAFDVRAGSLALARSIGYVASGVVLAVVDPGVGGPRRPVALRSHGDHLFVGPDNGLLMHAADADVAGAQIAFGVIRRWRWRGVTARGMRVLVAQMATPVPCLAVDE